MSEVAEVTDLIQKKTPMVAMVAPSFPVMYATDIIGKIRRLGFAKVVEVSAGAVKTNEALREKFHKEPNARFITSPCPSFVRLVRKKYPHLLKYVTLGVDSPMVASAKIVMEKYPGHRVVFIGPCIAKKMEAKEDHPELNIIVLSFMELESLFTKLSVNDEDGDKEDRFDVEEAKTRTYPLDGGLTHSSGIEEELKDDEIQIVSGYKECEEALAAFETNTKVKLLDVLFCEGGCIGGPGIASPLSKAERIARVEAYAKMQTTPPASPPASS